MPLVISSNALNVISPFIICGFPCGYSNFAIALGYNELASKEINPFDLYLPILGHSNIVSFALKFALQCRILPPYCELLTNFSVAKSL